ncbi:MAG: B12-binding domain-containing radical SAM protein [Planctomycetota bacterium]|jgi:radical SAM superfamily enzyme YgiQ (UPF0313 family)
MVPKILLVNPPVYDFAAYDFWLKPYGLLSVAGCLRGRADVRLFDYLDRFVPFVARQKATQSDRWGRGRFYCERVSAPTPLRDIPRYYRRFGLPRTLFHDLLATQGPFDFVLVQTMMTYWYPGVREVIEDIRTKCPHAKIVLGGNYATLCPQHAKSSGADLLISGSTLEPLWQYLDLTPDITQPALWEAYSAPTAGALKLSDGCPFNCTYCSVPQVYGRFKRRPAEQALAELLLLVKCGAKNVAFYDDALLFEAQTVLVPFLEEVLRRNITVNFHSPNALNARFITKELAELMLRAGFKTFYLGFESTSRLWQQQTGTKVYSEELATAVEHLTTAGAQPQNITAYQLLGHPAVDTQQLEESMRFVNKLGIRGMLADFSPIPGTPDGDACRKWVNMDEPLMHNKTAFPIIMLGFDQTNRLKDLQRKLNRSLS